MQNVQTNAKLKTEKNRLRQIRHFSKIFAPIKISHYTIVTHYQSQFTYKCSFTTRCRFDSSQLLL